MSDTTANIGTGGADSTVTQFYISTRSTLDETAVAIGSRTVRPLASGETHTGTTTVTIPNGVGASCNYYILAKANATSVGDEPITTNNVRAQAIKVCPDILVETLSAPPLAAPGSMIQIVAHRAQPWPERGGCLDLEVLRLDSDRPSMPPRSSSAPARVPGSTRERPMSRTTSVPLPATVGTASLYYILAVLEADRGVAQRHLRGVRRRKQPEVVQDQDRP